MQPNVTFRYFQVLRFNLGLFFGIKIIKKTFISLTDTKLIFLTAPFGKQLVFLYVMSGVHWNKSVFPIQPVPHAITQKSRKSKNDLPDGQKMKIISSLQDIPTARCSAQKIPLILIPAAACIHGVSPVSKLNTDV